MLNVGRVARKEFSAKARRIFAINLRKARLAKGLSQEDLGELTGLHRTYVSSVERGERNISLLNIEKLAQALGVTMAALMPDH